jgi:hypothetical protein
MDYAEWVEYGVDNGYCWLPMCSTHDIIMTIAEQEQWEVGDDPCVWILRLAPEVNEDD